MRLLQASKGFEFLKKSIDNKCNYYFKLVDNRHSSLWDFNYSGTYDLESFFDLGSGKSYNIPNVQPDDGCNIQFTSVSETNKQ